MLYFDINLHQTIFERNTNLKHANMVLKIRFLLMIHIEYTKKHTRHGKSEQFFRFVQNLK